MKNSNLIELLKTFSTQEIKKFSEFVRSPFFNKNESVVKLYDYLKKYHPDFDEEKVQKETAHKKIFPAVKYNDGFMRKIIFNLVNLAEAFMAYNRFTENTTEASIRLLDELNSRNMNKLFVKHFSELSKEIEAMDSKDYNYFNRKFLLENTYTRHLDNIRYKVDLNDARQQNNEHLQRKFFHFMNYTLYHSLNLYRLLKYQDYINSFKFSDEMTDNTVNYLIGKLNDSSGSSRYTENMIIKVHLYEIMLMNGKADNTSLSKDNYFHKLKDIFGNHPDDLPHDIRFSLYNILIQHSAFKILRGFSEYRSQRHELDKIALSQSVYLSIAETDFPPPAFASVVRNAAEMKEFDWALSFIEEYKSRLDENNFETVLNLALAVVHFNKGEFQTSLDRLNKIKPVKRWEFKFAVKELTLQLYYELSMFTQAYYLMDSFRHFTASMVKNFSAERIESRNNFLKYYSALLKLKENSSGKELSGLKKELCDTNKLIFNRDWLNEKTDELAKRK